MSALPPIEVPEDLPEASVFELERIADLDTAHGQEHKRAGIPESCRECRFYRRAMILIAQGHTTLMIEATERVARKLAEQALIPLLGCLPEGFWQDDHLLNVTARDEYRNRAVEIIEALDLDLSLVPKEL
jgi:hypothetical protein